VLNSIPAFPHIAVDTEGDFKFDPPLFLGFSVAYKTTGYYVPVGHFKEPDANVDEDVLELAMKKIEEAPLRVFQHAGHDLMVLDQLGYPMWDKPFACTMIMAHMINENLPSKSLDSLHKTFTGGVGKIRHPVMQQIIDTLGWSSVPVYLMNEYGTQDAVATSELFLELEPRYVEQFGPLY
jgi:DNA polymerase I-like protein with 3'-5' exonuclease and polymerase domains